MEEAIKRYIERNLGPAFAMQKAFQNHPKFGLLHNSVRFVAQQNSIQSKVEKNAIANLSFLDEPKFNHVNKRLYFSHNILGLSEVVETNSFAHQKYKLTTEKIFDHYLNYITSIYPKQFNSDSARHFASNFKIEENILFKSLYSIALTGIKIKPNQDKETALENEIKEVEDYLNNDEKKAEVNEFLVSVTEETKEGKIKTFDDYLKRATYFIHGKLLKNRSHVNVQMVYNLNNFLYFIFINIILPCMLAKLSENDQANFNKIYYNIQINNTVNNNYKATDTISFTLKATNIYLRNSDTTKCMGRVEKDITLIIKDIKPKWAFVEVQIEKLDMKTKQISYPIIRGWIRRDCIES